MKIKSGFFEKWMENLTNNRFKQGKHRLCNITNGQEYYCCLGVAEETLIEMGLTEPFELTSGGSMKSYGKGGAVSLPHPEHAKLMIEDYKTTGDFSIEMRVPKNFLDYRADDDNAIIRVTLPHLNDDMGLTFSQIADLIKWEHSKHV